MNHSMKLRPFTVWDIGGRYEHVCNSPSTTCYRSDSLTQVKIPAFLFSIRAKLFLVSLILLLIPLIGLRFVQEMEGYLRDGQQQVLLSAARILSASLSNRPDLMGRAQANQNAGTAEEIEQRRLVSVVGNRDPDLAAALGKTYKQSESIERLLSGIANDGSRIWVVDSRMIVRGLEGSLNDRPPLKAGTATEKKSVVTWFRGIYQATIQPLLGTTNQSTSGIVVEDASAVTRSVMTQVDRALTGQSTVGIRQAARDGILVQFATQPIWLGDDIVGAVVVEESDRNSRSIKIAGVEALLAMTLVIFLVGFVALMFFAWRLAFRVRRLQIEADRAIDAHGRITGAISGVASRDEIGALAVTLEDILSRLKRYNNCLEQMAARLSHELRTPVAVVRSSLDNLRLSPLTEPDRVYINRADEGIKRLSNLISRMSEANQLEQFLRGAERELFDIDALVTGCTEGYRAAFPHHRFNLNSAGKPVLVSGIADAIAQLLDKLIQNAIDFAVPDSPITVSTALRGQRVVLSVENKGAVLPETVLSQLFTSMVTNRQGTAAQDGHLGLGLYIVKIIADFHGGNVRASNLADVSGVRFEVEIPTGIS
jgi:two-component system, OmpR family, sensor histidine kinase ChvG